MKQLIVAIAAFVLLEIYRAKKAGRAVTIAGVDLSQIQFPQIDPVQNLENTERVGVEAVTIEEALMAIEQNPRLVADITPQGQFRVDTRGSR